jgi:precorrin-3B synthase
MSARLARGACPSLAAPMETGDGLLARLGPSGPVPLKALGGLCAAARAHGNGTMEVTARGNLQIRGLTPASAPRFADAVATLGIETDDGVPVIASPLPDEPSALLDADRLARELRHAIASLALPLAPKVSLIVDGGGTLHLDVLAADIRFRAIASAKGPLLHVALAGDAATATPLGAVAPDDASDAMVCLLRLIAAHGRAARAADVLRSRGIASFQDALPSLIALEPPLARRLPAEPVGTHALKDDVYALGMGLAFGHVQADTLRALTEIARTHGASWARPAFDRALLLGPCERAKVKTLRDEARRLNFAVDRADPRRRIVACPGAPACASGLIASREIAAALAGDLPLAGSGVALHVSGCAKGCAHPAPAPLTIVGTERGCGIVHDGTARAVPSSYVNSGDLVAEIDRIIDAREAADA